MVVGGGIGGIQASLDLVQMGYRVYLVDSGPSIGGVMGQLDKTFPTNDCSMCILSPKLVEVGRMATDGTDSDGLSTSMFVIHTASTLPEPYMTRHGSYSASFKTMSAFHFFSIVPSLPWSPSMS